MSDTAPVLSKSHGGYVEITLNRPERMNAFNRDMHNHLLQAFKDAEADPACKAVLLTGAGRGFSAGQDLTERVFVDGVLPDLSENLLERYNPLVTFIRNSRLAVVAAVNGTAAGAGASVALACDIVIAARSAKFIQAFSRIGLVPDAGGTWFLPRLLGDARARAAIMLAETVTADQAAQWGLIWKSVEDGALHDEASAICARLAVVPGRANELAKKALLASATNGLEQQLALEADMQKAAGEHPDYRRSVEAFRRKD